MTKDSNDHEMPEMTWKMFFMGFPMITYLIIAAMVLSGSYELLNKLIAAIGSHACK